MPDQAFEGENDGAKALQEKGEDRVDGRIDKLPASNGNERDAG